MWPSPTYAKFKGTWEQDYYAFLTSEESVIGTCWLISVTWAKDSRNTWNGLPTHTYT